MTQKELELVIEDAMKNKVAREAFFAEVKKMATDDDVIYTQDLRLRVASIMAGRAHE